MYPTVGIKKKASGYLPGYLPVLPINLGGKTGKYPGKYPEGIGYLHEGLYVISTSIYANLRGILRKFEPK